MHAERGGKRKTLRRLAGVAYERELRKELMQLHDQFHAWLKDRLDAFALSDAIHEFHDGAARVRTSTMTPSAGDREGQDSIRINEQYRVCLRWEDGYADDVEVTDYH